MNILILPSVSGDEYSYYIMYPGEWASAEAHDKAEAAIKSYEEAYFQWDNGDVECEEPDLSTFLKEAGFYCPGFVHIGPYWDER